MAEPPQRRDRRIARWWRAISDQPLWAALIATVVGTLIATAIIAHSGGVFGGNSSSATTSRVTPLRTAIRQVSPGLYGVAFYQEIDLPSDIEQWEALHARGGVDAGHSELRLTLANRSDSPLTVNNIQAVVRHSRPRPTGSLAFVYTQGASAVEGFGILLDSDVSGTTAALHRVPNGEAFQDPSGAPVFFPSHDIVLAPGEIYEARIAVVTELHRELEYGLAISGNTAQGGFSYTPTSLFRIVGEPRGHKEYSREYWRLESGSGPGCWILAGNSLTFPRCP